jgi:Na+-translocating ferredoxin:NAD+ oxidoreductase subunit B
MLLAIATLTGLALLAGFAINWIARSIDERDARAALARKLDAVLPQTQCGQCGYAGCRPYAIAMANHQADINQCPPGGSTGVRRLADLLGREPKPLNPENGAEKPRAVALIDEAICIGCTKCIQACPVDAILGAAKLMHTVIVDECTGCELCIPPCPVDCITMIAPASARMPMTTAPRMPDYMNRGRIDAVHTLDH